jgi:hypothetical protein
MQKIRGESATLDLRRRMTEQQKQETRGAGPTLVELLVDVNATRGEQPEADIAEEGLLRREEVDLERLTPACCRGILLGQVSHELLRGAALPGLLASSEVDVPSIAVDD